MRLKVFDSDKGDCVLLESDGGSRILCDGGMRKSMINHVRDHLGDTPLDLIHISHIDRDHISGILQLLEDALEWEVYDRHMAMGSSGVRAPRIPRPPPIKAIWHNSFRDQVSANGGDIEDLLAHCAPLLCASQIPLGVTIGNDLQRIAQTVTEALRVSRLSKPDVLGIPLNQLPGEEAGEARLIMRREDRGRVQVGDFKVHILGPSEDELTALRQGWNDWLARNRDVRSTIERYIRERVDAFASGADIDPFDLRDWNGVPDFRGVTAPNVASIVLMVEADGKRALITGDVQQDVLLEHLQAGGYLQDGHLHVDVLKVQHHGSEHNTDEEFCRRVSADHYVFCGNGAHTNPEQKVIRMYRNSRLGTRRVRSLSPRAQNRAFSMHFSTHSRKETGNKRKHMRKVQRQTYGYARRADGLMRVNFNRHHYLAVDV